MTLREMVKRLPYPVRQGVKYIYGMIPPSIRYGRVFWETYNFLQESQWWSREKLEEYQLLKLKELLTFCSKYVPFYQKRWAEFGINVKSIHDFSDFSKLPFTTKDDLKRSMHEMLPINFSMKGLLRTRTGGTTGSPVNFYETRQAVASELAFSVMYWSWHGCNFFKDRLAFFRGSYEKKERIERSRNLFYLPTWNLSKDRLIAYIKFINAQRISFIHGYPSLIYELFKVSREQGISMKHIKAVFFASEKPYDYQKQSIEEYFNIPVYCHYGHQEKAALFLQCEFKEGYHVISQYGYTEFEPVDNGELFEIVSTGFLNLATPLIRYRTEDYAVLKEDVECGCGRKYPKIVKDVVGRTGDLIIAPSGKIIQPNHLEYAIRFIRHFKDCQIIQDDTRHLRILIVPEVGYTPEEGENFKKAVLWRVDDDMDIDIELVENIPRPPNLKKRFTINLIKGGGTK